LLERQAEIEEQDGENRVVETGIEKDPKCDKPSDVRYLKWCFLDGITRN